jgi:hypothetical protein
MRQQMTHSEFMQECARRFGEDARKWKFICPACRTVQTIEDLLNAGLPRNQVDGVVAFSCIGRLTGQSDEGITAKNNGLPWTKGCNWTLGGLLRIHKLEVTFGDGGPPRPCFEIAPA